MYFGERNWERACVQQEWLFHNLGEFRLFQIDSKCSQVSLQSRTSSSSWAVSEEIGSAFRSVHFPGSTYLSEA